MAGKVLVLGGAGFIGSNAAKRYMDAGSQVVLLDNLSRKGTQENVDWLHTQGQVEVETGDIRQYDVLERFFGKHSDASLVIHMAAQVAVTTSVVNPREDFEINALGTFNVVEAMRHHLPDAVLVFASTNKVYGGMEDVAVCLRNNRYEYENLPHGVDETMQLDFHSPYGCSKGCADQYVIDYSRIYGLKTAVLRQSCIYGYRQFGLESQGWVAWFTIATVLGHPITIYGDGKQVRDVLFISDLLDAIEFAANDAETHPGQVYNIGGGPSNTMSLLELLDILESLTGEKIEPAFDDWRPGDQKIFVADIQRAEERLGWSPKVSPREGVELLYHWVAENKGMFENLGI